MGLKKYGNGAWHFNNNDGKLNVCSEVVRFFVIIILKGCKTVEIMKLLHGIAALGKYWLIVTKSIHEDAK